MVMVFNGFFVGFVAFDAVTLNPSVGYLQHKSATFFRLSKKSRKH